MRMAGALVACVAVDSLRLVGGPWPALDARLVAVGKPGSGHGAGPAAAGPLNRHGSC